jgi:hypothetical protein
MNSSNVRPHADGRDLLWAIGFCLVGILTRLPFGSRLLYHWDSVNFALALDRFDVIEHQPHPPGNFYYVMLGKMVNALVGDPNTTLVWISIVFSGLAAAALFYLTRDLYDRRAAIVTDLLFLSSTSVWFYGEVALTYVPEMFFVAATVLFCLRWLAGDDRFALPTALTLGLAGGLRQDDLVILGPLFAWAVIRALWRRSLRSGIAAVLVFGIVTLGWFAPTVYLTGGPERYFTALMAIGGGVSGSLGAEPLIEPVGRLGMYVLYGLLLGLIPVAYIGVKGAWIFVRSWRRFLADARIQALFLWALPNIVYRAPTVRAPGHTFSFLPALLIFAGVGLVVMERDLAHSRWSWPKKLVAAGSRVPGSLFLSVSVAGLLLVNVAFFFLAPPFLFGIRRVVFTTPGWQTIAYRDRYLSERLDLVQQRFSPESTVVVTAGVDYRHPDYYLPDFGSLIYQEASEGSAKSLSAEVETLVLFSETLSYLAEGHNRAEKAVLPSGDIVYFFRCQGNEKFVVDKSGISFDSEQH